MAAGGALVFAPVEYALTLCTYSGSVGFASKLFLVALVATLSLWLWLVLAIGLVGVLVGSRLVRAQLDPEAARGPGWFVASPLVHGVRRGVPRLWAIVITAIVIGLCVQRGAVWAMKTFKEPQLTAALVAAITIGVVGIAIALQRPLAIALAAAAEGLAPIFGVANTLGRWRAAGVALAALVGGGLIATWFAVPQSRSVLPVRLVISGIAIGLGMGLGAHHLAHLRKPRRAARYVGGGAFALVVTTLAWFGADLETRYVAITASPALDKLIALVRVSNDLDRDGFGSVLGENDCAPFDKAINPGANDKPGNTIDEDCDGTPLTWAAITVPPGPTKPVPPEFKKDWNFLFITIDTMRYDRTTFGGYQQKTKRNTTPRLAELVDRSTSFRFTQAPSAGTMASIPAILTSRFFHSGIAIDDNVPRGTPPKILPINVTLPEIMQRAGYYTGAIGSHEWWNNWGIEQGVDEYDNSLGKNHDPYGSSAHKVTDKILAWVSRQQNKKWFMWAHYIDPHGRYVAHPEVVDYGTSEPDLYDAELQWTDQQIGRLLDELRRLPSTKKTIIVITSDHGDSMGEHSVPLGTHGTALYREMLHVPMIIHIPGNPPRLIDGATSPLDVMPTIAELAGISLAGLELEGRSVVPQLFYGIEDRQRIVFAETNAPFRQRAAISEDWKVIYYMKTNLWELYDLRADPWEKTNLAPQNPPAFAKMKGTLQLWINRVVNARNPLFNQAFRQIQDVVLSGPPQPVARTTGQRIDGIEVLGISWAGIPVPGKPAEVHVYFRVDQPTTKVYRFGIAAWPAGTVPTAAARSATRPTADGAFATDQWKAGDHIRERFSFTLPPEWTGEVTIGLVAIDPANTKVMPTGDKPATEPTIAILGSLPR
jgi:arylsulfatase A-like enzyme